MSHAVPIGTLIRGRSRPDYIGPGGALIAGGRFYDVYPGGIWLERDLMEGEGKNSPFTRQLTEGILVILES